MNNKLFTAGEITIIQTNLNKIEKSLRRPIPGGLLDVSDLKDHILSSGEVITICSNIDRITKNQYQSRGIPLDNIVGAITWLVIMGLGAICLLFGWF